MHVCAQVTLQIVYPSLKSSMTLVFSTLVLLPVNFSTSTELHTWVSSFLNSDLSQAAEIKIVRTIKARNAFLTNNICSVAGGTKNLALLEIRIKENWDQERQVFFQVPKKDISYLKTNTASYIISICCFRTLLCW